jgi:hypothetical protein
MTQYPFVKQKKQKSPKTAIIIIVLLIIAVGIFAGIYLQLNKLGPLSALFQSGETAHQVPITAAPKSKEHFAVKYVDWQPYFFKNKLIYCDANYKCQVTTDIKADQVSFADRFSDGMARVGLKSPGKADSIVYLGISGKTEIAADPDRIMSGPFSEGLAFSVDKSFDFVGFIDKHGKYAIPAQFFLCKTKINPPVSKQTQYENFIFSSGKAPVYTESVNSKRALTPSAGYIDHAGSFVIPPRYLQACAFVEERARVCVRDNSKSMHRWGFIDPRGKRVIESVYMQVQNFSESLAGVLDYQGRWGFVNKDGKYVIPSRFDDAEPFTEGFAPVAITGEKKLWGYIRKDGNWLVEPRFDRADAFQNGEAYACNGEQSSPSKEEYWIDKTGKIERHSRQLINFDIKDLKLPTK